MREIRQKSQTEKKPIRRRIVDRRIYYICPKCGRTLEFRKQRDSGKCIRCGQKLDWMDFEEMKSVYILAQDGSEAAYWAETYSQITGELYGIDADKWRLTLKSFPMILFFSFPKGKDYGRFMRIAAKDGNIVEDINEEGLPNVENSDASGSAGRAL